MTARTPAAALDQADRIVGIYGELEGVRIEPTTGQRYYAPTEAMVASARALSPDLRAAARQYLGNVYDARAISLPSYLQALDALDEAA